jgi:uncharacterized membrane protein HdeD (DUF308 family)
MSDHARRHLAESSQDGLAYFEPFRPTGDTAPDLRRLLVVRGVLAAVAGAAILALLWWRPLDTLIAFGILTGAFFTVTGIIRAITGIVARGLSGGMRALNIVFGVLIGLIGFVAMVNPSLGLMTYAILIGVAWIFEGVAALSMLPATRRGIWVFFGIVALLAGLAIIALPWASVEPLIVLTGACLVAFGIVDIVNGARLNRAGED